MSTAVDTNIFIALWDPAPELNSLAQAALDAALDRGPLRVAAPVFAELLAAPGRSEAFLESFVEHTGIIVDWDLKEAVWRTAGRAFQAYVARRRRQRTPAPRRILADFLIGAHALENGCQLLTLDEGFYRTAFPALNIARV
jgi:hypothetical protein